MARFVLLAVIYLTFLVAIIRGAATVVSVDLYSISTSFPGTRVRSLSASDTLDVGINSNITLVANVTGALSVRFALNGTSTSLDSAAPFTISNNVRFVFSVGTYKIDVTPYSATNGSGTAGTVNTVILKVINSKITTSSTGTLTSRSTTGSTTAAFIGFDESDEPKASHGSSKLAIDISVGIIVPIIGIYFGFMVGRKIYMKRRELRALFARNKTEVHEDSPTWDQMAQVYAPKKGVNPLFNSESATP